METHELIQLIREGKLMKFYKSRGWNKKRLEALERDHKECQACKAEGKVTTTNTVNDKGKKIKLEVHHIKEVKTHPHLALELDNLKTLCTTCHNEVHDRLKVQDKLPAFVNEERW